MNIFPTKNLLSDIIGWFMHGVHKKNHTSIALYSGFHYSGIY